MKRRTVLGTGSAIAVGLGSLLVAGSASATPIYMPTVTKEIQQQRAAQRKGEIQPPAPPCPQTGTAPCGIPEAVATTLPWPGNMAYYGGHVQVHPKVYIVFWGWGQKGAFPKSEPCRRERIREGSIHATLRCDPNGAARYISNFVYQLGGTKWAGVQDQYYETVKGKNVHITNPRDQLGGIWVDDKDSIRGLPKTSSSAQHGPKNTYTDLAREAARAVAHFHIKDLADSNIVVAQPANYSDPNALATGYCAFHDYTEPVLESGWYDGIKPGISYTNLPYLLSINSSPLLGGPPSNDCGENAVNSGKAGLLDGFSIALGHEIEETVTDPGAEDILGSGLSAKQIGGWYDATDANENGDKCAWVGEPLLTGAPGEPNVLPVPGAMGDIKGNRGERFAVQSLWSNNAAAGLGYCAGAGTDLP